VFSEILVVLLLLNPASHISSASHVIKIVQVKPKMEINVNRRFDCQHTFFRGRGVSRRINLQDRLLPQASQCCHITVCLQYTSISVLWIDFSILSLPTAMTGGGFSKSLMTCGGWCESKQATTNDE